VHRLHKATYDHDANHDSSSYQTFAWIFKKPMKVGSTVNAPKALVEPRIMSRIRDALIANENMQAKINGAVAAILAELLPQ